MEVSVVFLFHLKYRCRWVNMLINRIAWIFFFNCLLKILKNKSVFKHGLCYLMTL